MNWLFVECLRIICILALISLIIWASQIILFLVRPWTSRNSVDQPVILLQPFDVVDKDKVQAHKGDACARLLSSRIRQINAVLNADLSGKQLPDGILAEIIVPKQYKTDALLDAKIDSAVVKPLGVDVVGVFNFLRRNLQKGDRVVGHVDIRDSEVDIFAELVSEGRIAGPWDLTIKGGMNDGLDALGTDIVKDLLEDTHPLSDLNTDQFREFVQALRYYQMFARDSARSDAAAYLDRARIGFENLESQAMKSALVYSYLASIRTLQTNPDLDGAIALLEKAKAIDPKDSSVLARLKSLKSKRPTLMTNTTSEVAADNLVDQASLQLVRLKEAVAAATIQRKIRIAVFLNGVNTTLPAIATHISEAKSFVDGEAATVDEMDYGTHVVSYLTTIAPSAEILVIKVLNEEGFATTSSLLQGIDYAIAENADILLCPLAGTAQTSLEENVYKAAEQQGVLIIAAAGNDGTSEDVFPAAYPGVFAVGATDLSDKRQEFSNFGQFVKLYAPSDASAIGTQGHVIQKTGSTFSATLVAGIAALAMQTGAEKSPGEVQSLLVARSKTLSASIKRVDALDIVDGAK